MATWLRSEDGTLVNADRLDRIVLGQEALIGIRQGRDDLVLWTLEGLSQDDKNGALDAIAARLGAAEGVPPSISGRLRGTLDG